MPPLLATPEPASRDFDNPSRIPFQPQSPVLFRHPGYNEPANVLLSLPRVDNNSSGVHHATALLACQVVANNAFQGRLYLDRFAACPVSIPPDGVLCAASYYFHVDIPTAASTPSQIPRPPPAPRRYPVVPRFADWQFPYHDYSHLAWPFLRAGEDAPGALATMANGQLCAVTGASWALESAHLVPVSESVWFGANALAPLAWGSDINACGNLLLLRSDVHKEMDQRTFAIVPRAKTHPLQHETDLDTSAADPETGHNPGMQYVVHILGDWSPATSQLAALYHNRPLQCPPQTSPHCLLARFAWTVFQQVKRFLIAGGGGPPRVVIRLGENGSPIEEEMDLPALVEKYGGGGSRTVSPKKRSREASSASASRMRGGAWKDIEGPRDDKEQEEHVDKLGGGSSRKRDGAVDPGKPAIYSWYQDLVAEIEEGTRGRPKKRARCGEEHGPLTPGGEDRL